MRLPRSMIQPSVSSSTFRVPSPRTPGLRAASLRRGVGPSAVSPSGCGCGASAASPDPLVYVVGSLGFDFGTEARRDALYAANGGTPIMTNAALAAFLAEEDHRAEASSIIWTLSDDQYPLYAIRPLHGFASDAYDALRGYLSAGIDRISVPGWIRGKARLMNGWVVPVIEPDVQGLRSWSIAQVNSDIGSDGGSLVISNARPAAVPNATDLTALGTIDWAYWGFANPTDVQHSAASDDDIQSQVNPATAQTAADSSYLFTWTNGTPTQQAQANQAASVSVPNVPFVFSAPADPTPRVLTVYVAITGCKGMLSAKLTDSSAPPASVAVNGPDGHYIITLTYQAASAASIEVVWTMTTPAPLAPIVSDRPLRALAAPTPLLVLEAATLALAPAPPPPEDNSEDLQNFMDRIYFELRNHGATAQERARNFAATQAYFVNHVITYAIGHNLNLQEISVSHSPLCRPGSECWDVTITLFDPENVTNTARKTFRFTIDVSDVKPVMIGPMYTFNSF